MMNETIAGLTGDFQTQYVVPAYDYQTMWAQQGIDINQRTSGAGAGWRVPCLGCLFLL